LGDTSGGEPLSSARVRRLAHARRLGRGSRRCEEIAFAAFSRSLDGSLAFRGLDDENARDALDGRAGSNVRLGFATATIVDWTAAVTREHCPASSPAHRRTLALGRQMPAREIDQPFR